MTAPFHKLAPQIARGGGALKAARLRLRGPLVDDCVTPRCGRPSDEKTTSHEEDAPKRR